ncbi:hypothetical protein [Kribbella sp. NPDC050470]
MPALKPKLAEARAAGWRKYPSVRLVDVVATPRATEVVFEAITQLTDR